MSAYSNQWLDDALRRARIATALLSMALYMTMALCPDLRMLNARLR